MFCRRVQRVRAAGSGLVDCPSLRSAWLVPIGTIVPTHASPGTPQWIDERQSRRAGATYRDESAMTAAIAHPTFRAADLTSSAVEVRDLTKVYGDLAAVQGVSFEVAQGEVFAFLGPNGAGKSTTIKMLCTLA